jgi:hypothetical protein
MIDDVHLRGSGFNCARFKILLLAICPEDLLFVRQDTAVRKSLRELVVGTLPSDRQLTFLSATSRDYSRVGVASQHQNKF